MLLSCILADEQQLPVQSRIKEQGIINHPYQAFIMRLCFDKTAVGCYIVIWFFFLNIQISSIVWLKVKNWGQPFTPLGPRSVHSAWMIPSIINTFEEMSFQRPLLSKNLKGRVSSLLSSPLLLFSSSNTLKWNPDMLKFPPGHTFLCLAIIHIWDNDNVKAVTHSDTENYQLDLQPPSLFSELYRRFQHIVLLSSPLLYCFGSLLLIS